MSGTSWVHVDDATAVRETEENLKSSLWHWETMREQKERWERAQRKMESRIDTAFLGAHLQPCDATAIRSTCHTDTQRGDQTCSWRNY